MAEMMKQFSLFSNANQVGRIIDEHFLKAKKQSTVHDYFKKVVKQLNVC